MVVSAREPVLALHGRLDGSTVTEVREQIHAAIDRLVPGGDRELVLDLTDVETVDATGLGVLAGAHRRVSVQGRRLVLRGCPAQLRRALAVTRLARVVAVERVPA